MISSVHCAQFSFFFCRDQLDETLLIVTADHSHTLTINGHPERGADILGMAGNSKTEETPYTTLTYGTSYKGFQVDPERLQRKNPALEDTTDWEYEQQAAINTNENLHGGSDVTLHARGKSDMHIDKYIDSLFILSFNYRCHVSPVPRRARAELCGPCDLLCAPYRTLP